MDNAPGLPLLFDVFENLPMGVVVLDQAGNVVVYNRAEEKLAGRKRPRDVHIKLNSFTVEGNPYAVLLIEDVSVVRSVDRMKEQSLLIHDLKNPQAIMRANLDFVGQSPGIAADPEVKEAIADMSGSAKRLQSMLLNLLDITRMETGTLPLKARELDVRALLDKVAEASRGAAKARRGSIQVADAGVPMPAEVDPELLRRALENLIDNAFRHAKNLTLREGGDDQQCFVQVEDDGPGIPEQLRGAVFEKFGEVAVNQASKSPSNRGLGLTFVKLAARAHGGDVEVICPSTGGSTFRLTFQRRRS